MFAMRAAILACSAVGVFWAFYIIDFVIQVAIGGKTSPGPDPFLAYFSFDPPSVNNPIASLAGVNAAVFGIVITVVSIIVQLTAERYTGVARMFLRDRLNICRRRLLRRRLRGQRVAVGLAADRLRAARDASCWRCR